jgi:hypothetical protein
MLLGTLGSLSCNEEPRPVPEHEAGSQEPPVEFLFSDAELRKPENCQSCHPGQYAEWAGSMHAYAAEDPVFLAMNRRGQEETGGKLGSFCVGCHAPLAVRDGLTEDGLNLAELPAEVRGVTCYFCHSVDKLEGTHNNAIRLADDGVLRGAFRDPLPNPAHASAYSALLDTALLDRGRQDSSAMCGACHDVTLPKALVGTDIPLERTFQEWQETLFARSHEQGGLSCNACHMPISSERERSAETSGAPARRSRRHDFEGIDQALTPFPNQARQQVLIERFLDTSLLAEICVSRLGVIEVTLENAGAGHGWPSGASQDREAWLEVNAFDAAGEAVYQSPSPGAGAVEDGGITAGPATELAVLREFVVDEAGDPAHMFCDVRAVASSTVLRGTATRDPLDPRFHRERQRWLFNTQHAESVALERVTLRVRMRPVALDVLGDLVESGHLDEAIAEKMPVLNVLPDRCYDAATREQFGALIGGSAARDCDNNPDREFTLVWRRENAVEGNRSYRPSRIAEVPADCLSHPTYVPAPR